MNNKFILKVCIIICVCFIACNSFGNIYARPMSQTGTGTTQSSSSENTGNSNSNNNYDNKNSFFEDIFSQGGDFFNPNNPSSDDEIGNKINDKIKNLGIIDAIMSVGNLIFIIITSILGLKYIFATSAEKADIKNGLITLCVAIIFFFLAQTVYDFANGTLTEALAGGTYESLYGKIWNTIKVVVNICAVLGIVLAGVRYMLASADTRADIKAQLVPIVIGIVLVYCTVNVINFVITVSQSAMV